MHVPPDRHVGVDPTVAGPPTLLSVPTQFHGRRQCQRQITEYFSRTGRPKRSPKVSFMNLPLPIREKIYSEANVAQGQFIDLNFWACKRRLQDHDEDVNEVTGRNHYWLSEQRFPVALLWASRLVHSEVEAMLYSTNTFSISLPSPDGLRPLETLSATAITKLTRLVVSLRPCRCIIPDGCSRIDWGDGINVFWPSPMSVSFWTSLEKLSANAHGRPLGRISRTDKNTLARWQRICGRLSGVRPGQLRLYVVANVADLQTAHAIVGPLRSIPVLDVAISLGDKKDAQLQSLARNSVLAQMNKLHYPPFRFLDLPLELQVQILMHTNLVAIHCVVWDPSERFRIIGSGLRHCSPYPGAGASHIKWEVFCAARHAAFNVRCECRDLPLNYFLVSKAFAVAARYVFYARNEFRLFPSHSFLPDRYASDADDGYYQLSLQSFLRRMPPEGIRNLTKVIIIFPPITPTYLLPEQEGWSAWVQAVDSLAQAELPRLNLELHFSDQDPLSGDGDAISVEQMPFLHQSLRARKSRDVTLEAAMLGTYKRILDPLEKISRPRSLLVHVPWPLCAAGYEDCKANESELERLIMGDDYDSAAVGKRDRSPYSQPMRLY